MSMPADPDSQFHIEVLKLLLQIVTSDDRVTRAEIDHLVAAARGMSVPLTELTALTQCLQHGSPLPAPNLGLLRMDPTAVIRAAQELITHDGSVHAEEIAMLRQIRELLGVTS
ncbi:TerB family tellurite resistance protein [Corallococcus sp. H22C18031201]|nr:TerB family tellurite resistance protein [Corallococcus sp. H22C18031201]